MLIPKPSDRISTFFTWGNALFLPRWNRMATEADGVTLKIVSNLTMMFTKMDIVRDYIGKPIIVHVAYRSPIYNALVGGSSNSAHLCQEFNIAAVDFHVQGMSCKEAIGKFMGKLGLWGMRMENNGPSPTWIHLDTRPATSGNRYFKP